MCRAEPHALQGFERCAEKESTENRFRGNGGDAHLINGGALIKVLGEARELLARGDLLLEVLIPQLVRPELRQLGLREVGRVIGSARFGGGGKEGLVRSVLQARQAAGKHRGEQPAAPECWGSGCGRAAP